jgi:hypothetical protein
MLDDPRSADDDCHPIANEGELIAVIASRDPVSSPPHENAPNTTYQIR